MSVINVVNVDVQTPAGKRYQVAEVIYKQNGETKTKKIMSFVNPAVFAVVKDAKSGDVYSITQEKDDKGYFQWTSITSGAEAAASPVSAPARSAAAPSTGRDFETKDERAERQKLIVRQSAVNYAISMLTPGAKTALDKASVFALAEDIVAFVTAAPSLIDMQSDSLD